MCVVERALNKVASVPLSSYYYVESSTREFLGRTKSLIKTLKAVA